MVAQLETTKLEKRDRAPYQVEGLIQVFTGAQRNFFTHVIAQALAIAAHGTPVLVVQFLKGGIGLGFQNPIRLGQHLDWVRCNLPRYIDTPHLDESEVQSLRQLWEYTQNAVLDGSYSLVVLDELSLAVHFGLIPLDEVVAFLRDRPRPVELILTGPEMPGAVLELADQITEIRRSHHP